MCKEKNLNAVKPATLVHLYVENNFHATKSTTFFNNNSFFTNKLALSIVSIVKPLKKENKNES